MKSYRTLALKELLSQKVTSILILIAVVLSTMMTTIVGQSIGVLSAMREQQAIAIGGNRYATFLQMNADQLHALEQDERLSYVGKSKLATTSSTGGLLLALQRAIVTIRPKGRYRKHFCWPAIKRYYSNLLVSILLLALLYTFELLHLLYCQSFQHNIL